MEGFQVMVHRVSLMVGVGVWVLLGLGRDALAASQVIPVRSPATAALEATTAPQGGPAPALTRNISLKVSSLPIGAVLNAIAQECGVRLRVVGQLESTAANLSVAGPAHQALARLAADFDLFMAFDGRELLVSDRRDEAVARVDLGPVPAAEALERAQEAYPSLPEGTIKLNAEANEIKIRAPAWFTKAIEAQIDALRTRPARVFTVIRYGRIGD